MYWIRKERRIKSQRTEEIVGEEFKKVGESRCKKLDKKEIKTNLPLLRRRATTHPIYVLNFLSFTKIKHAFIGTSKVSCLMYKCNVFTLYHYHVLPCFSDLGSEVDGGKMC